MNRFIAIVLVLASTIIAVCQTTFKMEKDSGHYFIHAKINDNPASRIFVETGLPGMLISQTDYDQLLSNTQLDSIELRHRTMIFHHRTQNINKALYGSINIGDLRYHGSIYVLDQFDKIGVPVHRLENLKDSTACMMRFDFKQMTLDFVSGDSVNQTMMHKFNITRLSPMPVIEATLSISDHNYHHDKVSGSFVFDMGNASPIFLFRKNKQASEFLKKSKLQISPAKDKSGRKVADGIFATYCRFGERVLTDISIGISNVIKLPVIGCIGPSMFHNSIVIIDPAGKTIYYEANTN